MGGILAGRKPQHRMIDSVVRMTTTTVALIFACILGVSGVAIDFEPRGNAMVLTHAKPWGVAFGGFAFGNAYNIDHELGHTAQEDLLGALYLPIIAIPSVISAALRNPNHRDMWAENWADELGGQ